jgi:hypothetical protein
MVPSCPGWSCEEIFSGLLSYIWFSSLWLVPMGSRRHRLLKMPWKKLTRNAPSRSCCKNTTYKMFKELVASQLITELKIREGKSEPESALKRLMDALKKHHQRSRNFQVATRVIMHNQEMQIGSKEKQTIKTFGLDVAEITPSSLDENSCTNNVVHTGSENQAYQ